MRIPSLPKRFVVAAALAAATVGGGLSSSASGATTPYAGPTPDASCDSGSLPEREQGRAPASDVPSHRSALGYGCNATQVSHSGATGGYRVERYVDRAGHECGYYDSTLLYPQNLTDQGVEGPGTYVMDMHDPAHPVHTDTLRSPAMQSPHESVRLNVKRGLLVADMGYPTANPGFVDVWDVSANCLHPTLRASSPLGVLGHESGSPLTATPSTSPRCTATPSRPSTCATPRSRPWPGSPTPTSRTGCRSARTATGCTWPTTAVLPV